MTVNLSIPVLGSYSATWPLSCPKSDAIVQQAADYYADEGIHGPRTVDAAFQALFLLSTGNDDYLDEVADYVGGKSPPGEGDVSNWALGDIGIVMSGMIVVCRLWRKMKMITITSSLVSSSVFLVFWR